MSATATLLRKHTHLRAVIARWGDDVVYAGLDAGDTPLTVRVTDRVIARLANGRRVRVRSTPAPRWPTTMVEVEVDGVCYVGDVPTQRVPRDTELDDLVTLLPEVEIPAGAPPPRVA